VEGGDRRIEGLGNLADRAGADPPAQDGSGALATLRVDSPRTKQAMIMRSMWPARRT
jgi:hypothetical protein